MPSPQMNAEHGGIALNKLREVVLLAGSVRSPTLIHGIGRSVFDLPIASSVTVLQQWQQQVADLAQWAGCDELPIRIMLDRDALLPTLPDAIPGVRITVERDPVDFRGTGGILRDLASRFDDDDYLLIANAAQILIHPLITQVNELAQTGGDIAVVGHDDGTPCGLMLLRSEPLVSIPEIGYHDLKEQALPKIAQNYRVGVARRIHPGALPMRTLPDYIDALRWLHKAMTDRSAETDPFEEDWQPTFQILEPEVQVKSGARVHDSVVLRGARIERGAVLVRSIVAPGGVVKRDEMVVDRLISAKGTVHQRGTKGVA